MSSFAQNATIVLVHGAWADGSCWQNIILPLRLEALKVMCALIPLTSYRIEADYNYPFVEEGPSGVEERSLNHENP
jgi:hypothetical protein